jgi:hypothetical protein
VWFVDGHQGADHELTAVFRVGRLGSCRYSAPFVSYEISCDVVDVDIVTVIMGKLHLLQIVIRQLY